MKQILSVSIRVCLCLVDWLKCSCDLLQLNTMKAKQISGANLEDQILVGSYLPNVLLFFTSPTGSK